MFVLQIGCQAQTPDCNVKTGNQSEYKGILLQYTTNRVSYDTYSHISSLSFHQSFHNIRDIFQWLVYVIQKEISRFSWKG